MSLLATTDYALVAAVAFVASILGGVTGYGTGLLLPPILVPLIGAEAVVPVISVSALLSNTSRLLAFRTEFDRRRAVLLSICALPPCALGAYGYTLLTGPGVSFLLGAVLIAIIPARRLLARSRVSLGPVGMGSAGAVYGFLSGGTAGTGIVLLAILLSTGLQGPAVVATDAAVSLVIGLAKAAVFQTTGSLPAPLWILAILIGTVAMPGAFIAKRIAHRMTIRTHTAILDGIVLMGGAILIIQGLQSR